MKRYVLYADVLKHHNHKKVFKSRLAAENYIFALYEKKYVFNVEVLDILPLYEDKHNLSYVCSNGHYFNIKRVIS